jgi:hypothetical protein
MTDDARKQEAEERRKRVGRERRDATRRVLKTEDGKLMLQMLEAKYDRELVGQTTDRTLINVGSREAVTYLRWVRDHEEPDR